MRILLVFLLAAVGVSGQLNYKFDCDSCNNPEILPGDLLRCHCVATAEFLPFIHFQASVNVTSKRCADELYLKGEVQGSPFERNVTEATTVQLTELSLLGNKYPVILRFSDITPSGDGIDFCVRLEVPDKISSNEMCYSIRGDKACSHATDCVSCKNIEGKECGWCYTTQQCLLRGAEKDECGICEDFSISCPENCYENCGGHGKCESVRGGGCKCDEGWEPPTCAKYTYIGEETCPNMREWRMTMRMVYKEGKHYGLLHTSQLEIEDYPLVTVAVNPNSPIAGRMYARIGAVPTETQYDYKEGDDADKATVCPEGEFALRANIPSKHLYRNLWFMAIDPHFAEDRDPLEVSVVIFRCKTGFGGPQCKNSMAVVPGIEETANGVHQAEVRSSDKYVAFEVPDQAIDLSVMGECGVEHSLRWEGWPASGGAHEVASPIPGWWIAHAECPLRISFRVCPPGKWGQDCQYHLGALALGKAGESPVPELVKVEAGYQYFEVPLQKPVASLDLLVKPGEWALGFDAKAEALPDWPIATDQPPKTVVREGTVRFLDVPAGQMYFVTNATKDFSVAVVPHYGCSPSCSGQCITTAVGDSDVFVCHTSPPPSPTPHTDVKPSPSVIPNNAMPPPSSSSTAVIVAVVGVVLVVAIIGAVVVIVVTRRRTRKDVDDEYHVVPGTGEDLHEIATLSSTQAMEDAVPCEVVTATE